MNEHPVPTVVSTLLREVRKNFPPETVNVERAVLDHFVRTGGCIGPPIPIEEIGEWLGFHTIRLLSVDDEFSGIVSPRDRLIGINGRHHRRRQRFSIAHELGHILLGHPPEHRCTHDEIRWLNREADQSAAELLMPRDILFPMLTGVVSLVRLAYTFEVSEQAMMRRLNRLCRSFPMVLPESVSGHRRSNAALFSTDR